MHLPRLSSAARLKLSLALVCLLVLGSTSCDRLQQRLIERRAEDMLQGDRQDWLSDGALHVILCGTGLQVVLGQDGMHFTLPANSQEILREKLD